MARARERTIVHRYYPAPSAIFRTGLGTLNPRRSPDFPFLKWCSSSPSDRRRRCSAYRGPPTKLFGPAALEFPERRTSRDFGGNNAVGDVEINKP